MTTINETQALEILNGLIARTDIQGADIATTFTSILQSLTIAFAPVEPVALVKKTRRRTEGVAMGWPAGVKRADYSAWKTAQQAAGVTTGISPHDYKAALTTTTSGVETVSVEPGSAPEVPPLLEALNNAAEELNTSVPQAEVPPVEEANAKTTPKKKATASKTAA